MKIQCNACEAAEATVLYCTDEVALCLACDQKVHVANQRISLSNSSSQMPKCDICQETAGYFFCLEDRALLCRRCDVSIHTVNSLVSMHQRFLVTGVKVGLEGSEAAPSSSIRKTHSSLDERRAGQDSPPLPKRTTEGSSTGQSSKSVAEQASRYADLSSQNLPFTGGYTTGGISQNLPFTGGYTTGSISQNLPFTGGYATGSISQWQIDEFLELGGDFNQNYDFMNQHPSKPDCELGDPDCSSILRVADAELEDNDCTRQGPDTFWAVLDIPSPPTASGLYWPKVSQHLSSVFVPDIIPLPLQNSDHYHHHSHGDGSKRCRRC